MRRQVLRFVVGFVLVLLLAGCGGDPKAQPAPITSSATSSPVSTSPSPPAMPEAAKADTKAGAIAFVRHYIEVFNYAQATGSSSELATLSSLQCGECTAAIRGLGRIYEAGGHIDGGSLSPQAIGAEHNIAEHMWVVLTQVDSGPQSVVASTRSSPTRLPGGRRSMTFSVVQEDGDWKVKSWTRT